MMKRFWTLVMIFCCTSVLGVATTIQFALNNSYSGGPPSGSGPWLTATFEDIGADLVKLTMTATNLVGSEDVRQWGFNINPTLEASLASLTFTHISGVTAASIDVGADASNEGPSHGYDFQFNWGSGSNSVFVAGVSSVYNLGGISGLNANSFNFASEGGAPSFFTAAHIQQIPGAGDDSAWIGSGASRNVVPEPSAVSWLLAAGVILASLVVARRRVRS